MQINDVNHQWGGYVTFDNGGAFGLMAADPNVYGRVYLATNGRGVIVGNPSSSLPTGWADADVNMPGNPGWSTSTETLSNGSTATQWIVCNGGGSLGISGTSDRFNFAYSAATGNASISAQLTGLNNADGVNNASVSNGTPSAGVMFRAGTAAGDVYAALVQTTGNQLQLQYRTTNGGSVTTTTLGSVPIGTEFMQLVRTGSDFSAFYSADGVTWSQLGGRRSPSLPCRPLPMLAWQPPPISIRNSPSATFANVAIHLPGDVNLDGHINSADIGALMQALSDQNSYQTASNLSSGDAANILDVNGNGTLELWRSAIFAELDQLRRRQLR